LVADALVYWRPDLMCDDAPDTGSLTGDFELLVERTARNDDDLISNDLVLRVAVEANTGPHTGFRMPDAAAAGGGVWSLVSRGADSVDEIRPPGFKSSAVTVDRWLGELRGCEL
jgi:hypothetical protein